MKYENKYFSLEIPDDWINPKGDVYKSPDKQAVLSIVSGKLDNPEFADRDYRAKQMKKFLTNVQKADKIKEIKSAFGGEKNIVYFKCRHLDFYSAMASIVHNDNEYVFTYNYDLDHKEYEGTIDEILESLKFE